MIGAVLLASDAKTRLHSIAQVLGGRPSSTTPARDGRELCLWGNSEGLTPDEAGQPTLLFGRIDNAGDIATELELAPGLGPAALYRRALARWGDDADHRLVGAYCAITLLPDARLRLVRSPWTAPPLHFVNRGGLVAASPLLRALFAAGHRPEVDYDYLVDQLAFDHRDSEPVGWFRGIGRVPLGTRVLIGDGRVEIDRYYDPLAVPRQSFARDEDYVERAKELLGEAADTALSGLRRPGLMLSGGLDSPLAAAAILRALPQTQPLPCFTFGPVADWDGVVPPHLMGDERALVREFAAMHPRIEVHFADPEKGGHDYRLRELLRLCAAPSANIANVGIFHGPFEAAVETGCDGLLTASLGNFNISLAGDWAYPEWLRKGAWGQLRRSLGARRAFDPRSRTRMLLAMAIAPNLPSRWQAFFHAMLHAEARAPDGGMSLLTAETLARQSERVRHRGGLPRMAHRPAIPRTRADAIRAMWASADSGEDIDLGFEQLYGIAHRDVTAYRPLIEYCHGLPTEQFERDGVDRRLARRMAHGIMPEAQRRNRRTGRHNADWHARLARRRDELHAYAEAMRAHPVLGTALDIDRMQALLVDWPEATPWDPAEARPRYFGITRALTAAQFVGLVEGRNDL